MAGDFEESRSDRLARAGFEGRRTATVLKQQPTDRVAEERLPTQFVRRLASAMVATAKRLDSSQPGAGWSEVLTPDAAWYFTYILTFWYLLRSGRGAEYQPSVRRLTTGANFFVLFNFLDSRSELKTLMREAWDAAEDDSAKLQDAVRTAAAGIGITAIRNALQIGLYQDIVNMLRKQVGSPAYAEQESRPAQGLRSPQETKAPKQALAISAPNLTDKQTCVAMLLSAGHSQEDAERICQGPSAVAANANTDLLAAPLARARAAKRPVLAMVSATWCGPCKAFKSAAQKSPVIAEQLRRYIFADFDTDTSAQAASVAERLGVRSYPTFIALSPDGKELGRTVGYRDPESFANWLRGVGGARVA